MVKLLIVFDEVCGFIKINYSKVEVGFGFFEEEGGNILFVIFNCW